MVAKASHHGDKDQPIVVCIVDLGASEAGEIGGV